MSEEQGAGPAWPELEGLPPAEQLGHMLSSLMPHVAEFWGLSPAEAEEPCVACGKPTLYRDVGGRARCPGWLCAEGLGNRGVDQR